MKRKKFQWKEALSCSDEAGMTTSFPRMGRTTDLLRGHLSASNVQKVKE
jgi:hypothetical protein